MSRRSPSPYRPTLEALESRLTPASAIHTTPIMLVPPHFTVGVDAAGNQHLFVLGLDNQVWEQNDSSTGTPTSSYFLVTPGRVKNFAVTTDSSSNLHLFAIGLDDQVWQVLFNTNGLPTTGYTLTRPGLVKSLTAGRDANNDPEIFVLGQDSQVYTLAFNANGSLFSGTPSYVLTAPGQVQSVQVAQPNAGKNPELFALGLDSQVWEATAPTTVASYNLYKLDVPGRIRSFAVGPDSAGDLHLFAAGLDTQVWQALFDSNGNATTPYRLTVPGAVKTVSAGQSNLSHPTIFVIRTDNRVATLGFNDNGTLLSQTPTYVLVAADQVQAITLGTANDRASVFAVEFDSQVYQSSSTSYPTYSPFALVAPGKIK
jgi:hypothetical protein